MVLVSSNLALGLFGIILIISGVIAWFMGTYNDYDKGAFHTFIAILTGLGVFVTFLFYYNVVELQNQQQQLAMIQEFARINDYLLDGILNGMKEASIDVPNFVLSLTPLTNTICCSGTGYCISPTGSDPVTPQTCTTKMTLSYRIFSIWQDVILSNKYIVFDSTTYIFNFLQRANSKPLYEQWLLSKLNFTPTTQIFGDLLFEYGLPITSQTPETYQIATQKLINDPRYKSLFK